MRFAIVLGLLVSLVGCSFDHPLHGDVTFTPEERAAIERGDALIAGHLGRDPVGIVWDAPHPADDAWCEPNTIVRRPRGAGGRHTPIVDEAGHVTGACLNIGTNDGAWYFERLATHELGHWYGLGHHDGRGIMNGAVIAPEWTREDDLAARR